MQDETINIEASVVPENEPTDETLKKVDELNEKISNNEGEWQFVENLGIVWIPNTSPMPGSPPPVVPSPPTPPPLLEEIVKWGNTLDFDNIPQNSVILVKLNVDDPSRVAAMQRIITNQVFEPRIEKLKEKHACILFMESGDDVSIMTEEDMKTAGWVRKEPSRIITPYY